MEDTEDTDLFIVVGVEDSFDLSFDCVEVVGGGGCGLGGSTVVDRRRSAWEEGWVCKEYAMSYELCC